MMITNSITSLLAYHRYWLLRAGLVDCSTTIMHKCVHQALTHDFQLVGQINVAGKGDGTACNSHSGVCDDV